MLGEGLHVLEESLYMLGQNLNMLVEGLYKVE